MSSVPACDSFAADVSAELQAVAVEANAALRRFREIFRSVRQHVGEIERRCGVSGSQLWALSVVVGSPAIRVKDLAQAMAVHQSTASNLIEQLSRQGLLRRERDRFDQRIVLLYATEAGVAVVAQAPRPLAGLLPGALARLDPARLASLNSLLAEIVESMRLIEPGAGVAGVPEVPVPVSVSGAVPDAAATGGVANVTPLVGI
ncbi:MAG: MarR family winged helix-turn-helix transcriptional regulator [Burkholderiaceae bacterium]